MRYNLRLIEVGNAVLLASRSGTCNLSINSIIDTPRRNCAN